MKKWEFCNDGWLIFGRFNHMISSVYTPTIDRIKAIHVLTIFTKDSFISRGTFTREIVDSTCASSSVTAGVTATFVDVCSTPRSSVSNDTGAAEGIIKVITGSTVLTRVACTFIGVYVIKSWKNYSYFNVKIIIIMRWEIQIKWIIPSWGL